MTHFWHCSSRRKPDGQSDAIFARREPRATGKDFRQKTGSKVCPTNATQSGRPAVEVFTNDVRRDASEHRLWQSCSFRVCWSHAVGKSRRLARET